MSDNPFEEKWVQWAALTTTILAVCAAIGSMNGGNCSTSIQLMTTQESNQWSYFQAKSIKQHVLSVERDMLAIELMKAPGVELKATLEKKIQATDADIARYEKEKGEIKAAAESLERAQSVFKRQGGNFGIAVMFFQISILMSSVGALMRRKLPWIVGLVVGAAGLLYFVNGFLIFF
jgi:hypothetical protein